MVSPQSYFGIAKGPVNTPDSSLHCQSDKLVILRCSLFIKDSLWSGNGTHGNEAAEGFSFSRMPRYGDASQPQFRPASNSEFNCVVQFRMRMIDRKDRVSD
jgi:hypothetical protein